MFVGYMSGGFDLARIAWLGCYTWRNIFIYHSREFSLVTAGSLLDQFLQKVLEQLGSKRKYSLVQKTIKKRLLECARLAIEYRRS